MFFVGIKGDRLKTGIRKQDMSSLIVSLLICYVKSFEESDKMILFELLVVCSCELLFTEDKETGTFSLIFKEH